MCIECDDTCYVEKEVICDCCNGTGEGYFGGKCQECSGHGIVEIEVKCKCVEHNKKIMEQIEILDGEIKEAIEEGECTVKHVHDLQAKKRDLESQLLD
jgi:hypothetical protein